VYSEAITNLWGETSANNILLSPLQRPGSHSKAGHVEFVLDKMLLKSALKITVGKVKEWFLKNYSILGCDTLNFKARTYKQWSDKKT
jgi:hypothetical protein